MNNNKLIAALNSLVSENQNPDTMDIDLLDTDELVAKLNQQDHLVSKAITEVLPEIAEAVDVIVSRYKKKGRLIYIGAGTSGRLGVLDAVECVPTFGIADGLVIGLLAGGNSAMFKAKEGVEDQESAGVDSLQEIQLCANDIVVGVAASGRTPYVIGALKYAQDLGAATISVSCNPKAEIADYSDITILPIVGPEPLTGSTRMKSGSAQKMVLNMLSTAAMIRMGKSYKNLMVDVKASNEKLYARGTRMVMSVCGADQNAAEKALKEAGMQVKTAILMLLADVDANQATKLLDEADGFLRKALILQL